MIRLPRDIAVKRARRAPVLRLAFLAVALIASSAYPFRQADVDKLLVTRECQWCDLRGALINDAQLSGADLSGANLSDAQLSGADLSGANLSTAYLRNANLSEANLSAAYLVKANLTSATLKKANLLVPLCPAPPGLMGPSVSRGRSVSARKVRPFGPTGNPFSFSRPLALGAPRDSYRVAIVWPSRRRQGTTQAYSNVGQGDVELSFSSHKRARRRLRVLPGRARI